MNSNDHLAPEITKVRETGNVSEEDREKLAELKQELQDSTVLVNYFKLM